MGARNRMTLRATVERDMQTGKDGYNNPAPPDWQVLHASLPCWFWAPTGRETATERSEDERTVHLEDSQAMVPLGSGIRRRDRIAQIRDRLGQEYVAGPFYVVTVARRKDHLELLLERRKA